MRTLTYQLRDLKKVTIEIGFEGENNRTQVRIDCGEVFAEYPNAEAALKVQAPKGGIYPATVTRDGDMILWTVRDCDVANKGNGEFQLTFTDGETVVKTCPGKIHIDRSLKGSGTAPSGVQDWLENAEKVLEQVESAEIHQPMIGLDGYWYKWDQEEQQYVTTGEKARGEDGEPGQPGTDATPELITVPYENLTFPVAAGTQCYHDGKLYEANQAIQTSEQWTAAHWTETTVEKQLNTVKSALTLMGDENGNLEKRAQNVDGLYYLPPSKFEIGNLSYSSSGWSYPAGNTTRVRTKQGVSFKLAVGDVVSLSSYTNAKFYLSWKNTSDVYKNSDWKTVDYTITEAGDYVVLLTNLTEVTQTSIDALYGLLTIKKANYGIKNLESEIEKRDKNILLSMFGTADVPIDTSHIYNGTTHTFTSNPNRISFAEPYQFNTGDKLSVDVASGEKFYLLYFNKVNNTGTINTDFVEISGSATGWKTADTEYVSDGEKYVFVMVAFSADTKITTETVKTKITLTKATLPDYWKSYLTTKAGDINTAMDAVGGIGDAFVFYTDPHWGSKNQKHTPQIIKFLLDNTSLREVYCGGDVIDSSSGGFTGYCRSFRDLTVFTCRGNHDQNPNASDATDIVPDSEYYNRILKPIEHIVETNGKLYFYRDNPSAKIRYIFMDSGSARADTLTTTQLTWMQNALTSLTSDWSAVVIQHIAWDGAYASSATLSLATQGTKTINAINDVWSQMNCQFIGIISGHVHRDYSITESTHGYPIIATSCDVGGTGRTDYDPENPATVGTTNEHIMDVFIINKSTRTITVKRIGAGSDRSFTYPAMS